MRVALFSHQGPVREHNEDTIFSGGNVISGCSMFAPVVFNTEIPYGCFAVVDGMGGERGGEVAAKLVAESFLKYTNCWNVSIETAKKQIDSALVHSMHRMVEIADQRPDLRSMGAAVAGVTFCAEGTLIFNSGDCRVYSLHDGALEKLSHEHSVVQDLFDEGRIDEEGMRHHSQKNILTGCVSTSYEYFETYVHKLPSNIEHGKFLICSDGVWEALSKKELEDILLNQEGKQGNSDEHFEATAKTLANRMLWLGKGCRDNISFILVG